MILISYSQRNNRLVWDEAVSIMNDLFNSSWENKKEVTIDNCLGMTLSVSLRQGSLIAKRTHKGAQFSLYVISAAGFGRKMSWKEEKVVPSGHLMSFKTSICTVTTYLIHRLLLPDWAVGLTKKTREIDLGFKELRVSPLVLK
jgi:hypothetical protein